jgi:16S rRNA C967 or C1407 C5-methylase (RsmB/RsmF family)/NOL1/NOP2/fmu family ribosome biogenesis protein
MRSVLGEDGLRAYLISLEQERTYGLRANPLKTTPAELKNLLPFLNESIPWCEEGFYFSSEYRPAKNVFYHAGLFYLQEPSAMLPAAAAQILPGEKILDLCAAPGGKTTQAAGYLQGKGLIVTNDISASRARALVKNCELSGITNYIALCEQPEKLAKRFPEFFDCVLVDAPCSGEGMYRKNPGMINEYLLSAEQIVSAQSNLINIAAQLTNPSGRIVYSTCTFRLSENEEIINKFLTAHTDFYITPLNCKALGIEQGFIEGTGRIWPHLQKAEGHFVCVLQRRKTSIQLNSIQTENLNPKYHKLIKGNKFFPESKLKPFWDFCGNFVTGSAHSFKKCGSVERRKRDAHPYTVFDDISDNKHFNLFGESLYLVPDGLPDLSGIRIARGGWYLGELKEKRFEPSQAFAIGLKKSDVTQVINYSYQNEEIIRYLKGESFEVDSSADGWNLVCVENFPLGWGKIQNGRLKNKFQQSWIMR